MLLLNDLILTEKQKRELNYDSLNLSISKNKGDIMNVMYFSAKSFLKNVFLFFRSSLKNFDDINKYLVCGSRGVVDKNNIKNIIKNMKVSNVVYVCEGVDVDAIKEDLISKMEKELEKSNAFGYLRDLIPFFVGIFLDVLTVPNGLESLFGLLISLEGVKDRIELKKLGKSIGQLDVVSLNMKEYIEKLKSGLGNIEVEGDLYYDLNDLMDVLFVKFAERTDIDGSDKKMLIIKKILNLNYKYCQSGFEQSDYDKNLGEIKSSYLTINEFLGNICKMLDDPDFGSFYIGDEKKGEELLQKFKNLVKELLDQNSFEKHMLDKDPLPQLDRNLIGKNLDEKQFYEYSKFLDNYFVFRLLFLTAKSVENLINSVKSFVKKETKK